MKVTIVDGHETTVYEEVTCISTDEDGGMTIQCGYPPPEHDFVDKSVAIDKYFRNTYFQRVPPNMTIEVEMPLNKSWKRSK